MRVRNWSRLIVGILAAVLIVALTAILVFTLNSSPDLYTEQQSSEVVKIHVQKTGLHEVALEDLKLFNQHIVSLSVENLRLSERGISIPYFLGDDTLYFYGLAPESRYAPYRPYILSMVEPGLLMNESKVSMVGNRLVETITDIVHLEENNQYDSRSIPDEELYSENLDPWYWTTVQNDDEITIEFTLSEVDDDSNALLRTALYGATGIGSIDPDHDIDLYLNGIHVDTITWDGETHTLAESLIEPGILHPGINSLLIDNRYDDRATDNGIDTDAVDKSRPSLDIIRLDWVEIEYSRMTRAIDDQVILSGVSGDVNVDGFSGIPWLIDITDRLKPELVIGWKMEDGVLELSATEDSTLLATGPDGTIKSPKISPIRASNWHDTAIQADLIILSTDELSPALTTLVQWREEQGLGVVLVSVEDVYNEFGDGEASPESVAAFVRHAMSEWREPKPAYILLVGEASYDYKDYLEEIDDNVIPAPMVRVEYGGETVSDARLADVDLDGLPDVAIGRWPVSTENEVSELVERTIAYEQGTVTDNVLMAADGTSQEFISLSEEVFVGSGIPDQSAKRLYGVPADQFTDAWNEGAWLVSYAGHGSIDRWGKDDVFSTEAVPDLNADGPPPIVIQLTCLTGFYAHPTVDSISEMMLRHKKGPVEIIAATSLTLSSSQRPFGVYFIKALQDRGVTRIGDALQMAKEALDIEHNQELLEISETFTLLGDPSALIIRPDQK